MMATSPGRRRSTRCFVRWSMRTGPITHGPALVVLAAPPAAEHAGHQRPRAGRRRRAAPRRGPGPWPSRASPTACGTARSRGRRRRAAPRRSPWWCVRRRAWTRCSWWSANGGDLRQVGDHQHLTIRGPPGPARGPPASGRLAADAGVDLVEHHRGRARAQHQAQRQHRPGDSSPPEATRARRPGLDARRWWPAGSRPRRPHRGARRVGHLDLQAGCRAGRGRARRPGDLRRQVRRGLPDGPRPTRSAASAGAVGPPWPSSASTAARARVRPRSSSASRCPRPSRVARGSRPTSRRTSGAARTSGVASGPDRVQPLVVGLDTARPATRSWRTHVVQLGRERRGGEPRSARTGRGARAPTRPAPGASEHAALGVEQLQRLLRGLPVGDGIGQEVLLARPASSSSPDPRGRRHRARRAGSGAGRSRGPVPARRRPGPSSRRSQVRHAGAAPPRSGGGSMPANRSRASRWCACAQQRLLGVLAVDLEQGTADSSASSAAVHELAVHVAAGPALAGHDPAQDPLGVRRPRTAPRPRSRRRRDGPARVGPSPASAARAPRRPSSCRRRSRP